MFFASSVMCVYAPLPETSSRPEFASPHLTRFRSLRWVCGVRYASTPMIGLTSYFCAVFQNSYAPNT